MSVSKVFSFVALAFFFLIISTAVPVGTVADTAESHDDKLFLQQAANSISWLIILGELARKQAASGDVRQKSGADFDRNYISLMLEENRCLVSSYQREAQKGMDAEIRAFAYEKIKILEGYLAWAHQLLQDLPKPLLK